MIPRRMNVFAVLLFLLCAGQAYCGKPISAKIKKGVTPPPAWVSIRVLHVRSNLYQIAVNVTGQERFSAYRLELDVNEGSMKGVKVDVAMKKVKPGYDAGVVILPKELFAKATLTLTEYHRGVDQSTIYRIDISSYLPKDKLKETTNQ